MRNAKYFMSINPSNNVIAKEFPFATATEVDNVLDRAYKGFKINKSTPLQIRIQKILKMADVLNTRRNECASVMAKEMGKPVKFGNFEVDEVIGILKHKAAVAEAALQPKILGPIAKKAYTLAQPMGIHFCKTS